MHSSNLGLDDHRHTLSYTYFTYITFLASYTKFERFFSIMSTFYVISNGFLSKSAKVINAADRNFIEILRHAIFVN